MRELLPANLVRVIVREWMCSKADVFNLLVHKIADKVAPIAQQEAARMICREHFDNPWREIAFELISKFDDAVGNLEDVLLTEDIIWGSHDDQLLTESSIEEMRHALNWAEERKMKLHADVDQADDDAAEKGGKS